jgi:hypothetical protein
MVKDLDWSDVEADAERMRDAEIEAAEADALGIWQNGSNDDVWNAIFERGEDVAGALLEIIRRVPEYTVGDLTHEQVIANIERRYPILGPNPHFGR